MYAVQQIESGRLDQKQERIQGMKAEAEAPVDVQNRMNVVVAWTYVGRVVEPGWSRELVRPHSK